VSKPLISNVDNKLTDAERKELEFLDDLEGQIDDHMEREVAKGETSSGYQFLGAFDPNNPVVTEGHANNSVFDIRRRRDENIPVKPVWVWHDPITGDPLWILNDEDAEAARQGYLCPNCLSWQESNISLECKTPRGFSCGFERDD
jgi:hypothetical protein